MNRIVKNALAGLTAGVLLLSSASCGMIEMRATASDSEPVEETAERMLEPAERKNSVETREETEATAPEEPAAKLSFCLTGDILVDDAIIRDAANRATDGKSYSFIRMYTGVFRNLSTADIVMGSYSAADVPFGSNGEQKTPIESLAALSDIGYDVLDTSFVENDTAVMREYDVTAIAAQTDAQIIEQNGVAVSFIALSEADADKVREAASASDMLIVSMNWSENVTDSERENIARDVALAGADVIVGDGSTLGAVEWLDTGDGSPTLVAYSLGNLLATSDDPYALCGGILEFTAEMTVDGVKLENAVLTPTVVRYTEEQKDYQLVMLTDYTEELAAGHAVDGMTAENLLAYVRKTVTAEFLNPSLRG